MKKALTIGLYFFFLSALLACSLIYRGELSAGVSFGMDYCLKVLVPALFPMMFLSALVSLSPAAPFLCRLFGPVTRRWFRLPQGCFIPIFFGLTCGYPVGAKLTAGLLRRGEITPQQAGRLLLFAVCPGAPFALLFVGGAIFGDLVLGFFLFLSTVLAALLLGLLSGLNAPPAPRQQSPEAPFCGLMPAVDKAARSTLQACLTLGLYVMLFSAYLPLLHSLGIFQQLLRLFANPLFTQPETAALMTFAADVVQGVGAAQQLGVGPHIFALGLAFGGICVHLQVFSLFPQRPVGLAKFYLFRLLHGALSYGLFTLMTALFPRSTAVFSSQSAFVAQPFKGTVTGSVCLILLALTYIALSGAKNLWKKHEFNGMIKEIKRN